jgi:hypothetical protein
VAREEAERTWREGRACEEDEDGEEEDVCARMLPAPPRPARMKVVVWGEDSVMMYVLGILSSVGVFGVDVG